MQNVAPTKDEVGAFLAAHQGLKVLLCNMSLGEIEAMEKDILAHPAAFVDLSGLRSRMGCVEYVSSAMQNRLVFGTMAPILSTKAACLHLEKEAIEPAIAEQIRNGSAFV